MTNDPRGWVRQFHDPYPVPSPRPYASQDYGWVPPPAQFSPGGPAWAAPAYPAPRPRRTGALLGGIAVLALVAAAVGAIVALPARSSEPQPMPVPARMSTPTTSPPAVIRILPAVRDTR